MWRCRLIGSVVAIVVVAIAVEAARPAFVIVRVEGQSMQPALLDRSRVLVLRSGHRLLRRGTIVLARYPLARPQAVGFLDPCGTPYTPFVIKRVAALAGDTNPRLTLPGQIRPSLGSVDQIPQGHAYLLGDAQVCEDSRLWGPVPMDAIVGRVVVPWPQ